MIRLPEWTAVLSLECLLVEARDTHHSDHVEIGAHLVDPPRWRLGDPTATGPLGHGVPADLRLLAFDAEAWQVVLAFANRLTLVEAIDIAIVFPIVQRRVLKDLFTGLVFQMVLHEIIDDLQLPGGVSSHGLGHCRLLLCDLRVLWRARLSALLGLHLLDLTEIESRFTKLIGEVLIFVHELAPINFGFARLWAQECLLCQVEGAFVRVDLLDILPIIGNITLHYCQLILVVQDRSNIVLIER